jgi:hypothetical protein
MIYRIHLGLIYAELLIRPLLILFIFRPPVYFKGKGVLAGDVPLGKPQPKQLELVLRNFSEAKPVQSKLNIYNHFFYFTV